MSNLQLSIVALEHETGVGLPHPNCLQCRLYPSQERWTEMIQRRIDEDIAAEMARGE